MNEQVVNNKDYEKFAEFKNNVIGILESLSDPPKILLSTLKSRITDKFHILGTAKYVNS